MDSAVRQSAGRAPTGHLDVVEKIKRDEAEHQAKRSASSVVPSTMPSPYAAPLPPYAYSAAPTAEITPLNGVVSPPSSRRNTQEGGSQPSKQSLPSLAEALGSRASISCPRSPKSPPPEAFSRPLSTHDPWASAPASYGPANTRLRTPPVASQPYALAASEPTSRSQPIYPSVHSPSAWMPQSYTRWETSSRAQSPGSSFPRQVAQPHCSQAPLPRPYVTTYPAHSPSTSRAPPWPSTGSEHDSNAKKSEHSGIGPYGESVKRSLDTFDYYKSLNEVQDSSSQLLSFSELWRERAHHMPESGPSLRSMPQIPDVDDMIAQCSRVQESLSILRERVEVQQAELAERSKRENAERAPRVPSYDESMVAREEAKVNPFAGGDSKKRRGRAAPPGRCHSCNREETPEWRRGPDGARTLCNACGLHYAKLTRKMGANKAAVGSSNLRPKSPDRRSSN